LKLNCECSLWMQDDQSLPSSTPASSSRDRHEHEGKVEIASCTSAAASTAGSATSDGPEHLESGHWRFEAPNLILDTETGKVFVNLVSDPDMSWCICSLYQLSLLVLTMLTHGVQ